MSYFKRQDAPGTPNGEPQTEVLPPLQTEAPNEDHADADQRPSAADRVAEFRARIASAFQSFDKARISHPSPAPGSMVGEGDHDDPEAPDQTQPAPAPDQYQPAPDEVIGEVPVRSEDARFPLGALGYQRAAVDERIAELEQQLEQLRLQKLPMSMNEEIERLGEQTASILVVAHDQANETTRRAQEQADRCIADAAANAVAMTAEAKRQLQEVDSETDAIWRERSRLLDDARDVGLALIALAEEGMERFPEEVRDSAAPKEQ